MHAGIHQTKKQVKQPVPFVYFHALTMLQFLDCLVLSYALVVLDINYVLTGLIYASILVGFLGTPPNPWHQRSAIT